MSTRLFALVLGLLAITSVHAQSVTTEPELDLAAVREKVREKAAVLIDVREQSEWDERHLKVAHLIPLSVLRDAARRDDALAKLSPEVPIYCHCKAGLRAKMAAEFLREQGFKAEPIPLRYEDIVASGFAETKSAEK